MAETIFREGAIEEIFEEVRPLREQVSAVGSRRRGDENYVSEARNALEYDEAKQADRQASFAAASKIQALPDSTASPFHRRLVATAIISGRHSKKPSIDEVKADVLGSFPVFDRIYDFFDAPAQPVARIVDANTVNILQSEGINDLQLGHFNNVAGFNNPNAIASPPYNIQMIIKGLTQIYVPSHTMQPFPEYVVRPYQEGDSFNNQLRKSVVSEYSHGSLSQRMSHFDPNSPNYQQPFIRLASPNLELPEQAEITDELNYALRVASQKLSIDVPNLPELSPTFKSRFAECFGQVFSDVLLAVQPRDAHTTIRNHALRSRNGTNTVAYPSKPRDKSLADYTTTELKAWFTLVNVNLSDAVEATKNELERTAATHTAAAIAETLHAGEKIKPFFARLLDIETA